MSDLIAEKFFKDSAVQSSIDILIDTLQKHQSNITGPKPPAVDKETSYQELLEDFKNTRGAPLFFPYIASGIGNGPLVELKDGSVKYDFISGIGVHHFGHSHPHITKIALLASLSDTVMQGHLQQSIDPLTFSKKILELATQNGSRLKHCFLSSTGVMAGENALKIAFQKNHPANRVLAFENCFAGRTLAFAHITDKPAYRQGIPKTINTDYIPFFDHTHPKNSTKKACDALRRIIARYPKQHAAMLFELIQGEGGFYPGTHEFHKSLMEICKENGIAVLADEVQTFARTSSAFAFQHFNLDEYIDIAWIGKSTQVCATLYSADYNPKAGLLSQTFTSSSTAIAAGHAILEIMSQENYFGASGKIQMLHDHFIKNLKSIQAAHPELISGPYGEGLMIAFKPLDGSFENSLKVLHALFKNGLISFITGMNPTRIRFLIPAGATEPHHIDEACKIIEETLLELPQ